MEIGMMWYDPDPSASLPEKVNTAVVYYRRKYGVQPTHCWINPRMIAGTVQMPPCVVIVKTSPSIMMDHFWLGVDNPVQAGTAGESLSSDSPASLSEQRSDFDSGQVLRRP